MKSNFWLIVLILPLTVISCQKENTKENSLDQQIYFNSFESQSDTVGWKGYAFNFSDDVPSHGGKISLSISGGCILPHAQYTVSAQNTDYHLVLKLWGKNMSNGGSVYLNVNKTGYRGIGISVSEKEWTLYESQDTLFCPANTSLTLGAIAGGIMSSAILIDLIEIRKLNVNP
jgi:hypothetical protein